MNNRQFDGTGSPTCGDVSPDGKHRCVFGAGHECPYHSRYPHAWRNGQFIDPYSREGLAAAGLTLIEGWAAEPKGQTA